jgi:hypothetical protein
MLAVELGDEGGKEKCGFGAGKIGRSNPRMQAGWGCRWGVTKGGAG